MLAGAQEQIGELVVRNELLIRYLADEVHVGDVQPADEIHERREVTLEEAEDADDDQPAPGIEERLIRMEEPDESIDPLVGDDPADKQHVSQVVVELARDEIVGRHVEVIEVWNDRQDRRPRKAERLQVLPVEFRVAQRDLTGYELKVRFERALGDFWQLNSGQVYSTLERLRRAALVARQKEAGTVERSRYTILARGRLTQ